LRIIFFYILRNVISSHSMFHIEGICQNEFPLLRAHKLCIMSYVNEKLCNIKGWILWNLFMVYVELLHVRYFIFILSLKKMRYFRSSPTWHTIINSCWKFDDYVKCGGSHETWKMFLKGDSSHVINKILQLAKLVLYWLLN
jgi:hypothetical protein